ncbi:hypothetical protein [Arsenicicoccus piscis]|uniref:EamA domain-containing protein n=1 Tax=Arsenicicoccus piscis TaxID=673954 RepID=A0ABQ6HSB3_9MICO|nr:hypothetical protein [Arsenicicoccus piscis]GMA21373.1 hypothetical protein GCM10025862_33940 [Arsenicicoccus piscis]
MAVNPLLRPGLLATITAGVLWGTTGTTQALAPAAAEPQSVGALRMVLGTATMAAIVLIGGESRAIPRELPRCVGRPAGWSSAASRWRPTSCASSSRSPAQVSPWGRWSRSARPPC